MANRPGFSFAIAYLRIGRQGIPPSYVENAPINVVEQYQRLFLNFVGLVLSTEANPRTLASKKISNVGLFGSLLSITSLLGLKIDSQDRS